MIISSVKTINEASIQQHAVFVQQKARILIAFTVAMFLLCVENVKAFTAPLCNPDTLLLMASGAHSFAKRWTTAKPNALSIRQTSHQQTTTDCNNEEQRLHAMRPLSRSQRNSITTMKMAFSFVAPSTAEPQPTLDIKTSINAFGSWYNKMDPVARPPDYDDDETDYTLSSPADNWPSSLEEEIAVTSTAAYSTQPRSSSKPSFIESRRPRPIRTIRKIAGWFLGSSSGRMTRGFGSQTLL